MRQSLQPSRDPADFDFVHRVRTRFAETDAMGVIHHAAYLPYLEEARVGYLAHIGRPYEEVRETGVDMAVLEVMVRYRRALYFNDEVSVHLKPGAITRTTFQIAYLLTVGDDVCATAVTVHGCIDAAGRPARLPAWVARTLGGGSSESSED